MSGCGEMSKGKRAHNCRIVGLAQALGDSPHGSVGMSDAACGETTEREGTRSNSHPKGNRSGSVGLPDALHGRAPEDQRMPRKTCRPSEGHRQDGTFRLQNGADLQATTRSALRVGEGGQDFGEADGLVRALF